MPWALGPAQQLGLAVDELLKLAAVLQPLGRQAVGQAQFRQAEVGTVGVLADEEADRGPCRESWRAGRA